MCTFSSCVLRPARWRRTSSKTHTVCLWCSSGQYIMPNTHRRRRRDETVLSRRRRRCVHEFANSWRQFRRVVGVNTHVGSRDPVYNFLTSCADKWRHRPNVNVNVNVNEIFTPCLKKLCKLIFCQNFVKFRPIVKIFGKKIAKRTSFSAVYSFSTSPDLC